MGNMRSLANKLDEITTLTNSQQGVPRVQLAVLYGDMAEWGHTGLRGGDTRLHAGVGGQGKTKR